MTSKRQQRANIYNKRKRAKIFQAMQSALFCKLTFGLAKINDDLPTAQRPKIGWLMHQFLSDCGFPRWESAYPNRDFYSSPPTQKYSEFADADSHLLSELPWKIRKELFDVLTDACENAENKGSADCIGAEIKLQISSIWLAAIIAYPDQK